MHLWFVESALSNWACRLGHSRKSIHRGADHASSPLLFKKLPGNAFLFEAHHVRSQTMEVIVRNVDNFADRLSAQKHEFAYT